MAANDGMGWGEGCLKDVPIVRPFQTQGGCDWWEKADDVKETRKNPDQSDHECVAVQQVHGQMTSVMPSVLPIREKHDGSGKTGDPSPSAKTGDPSPSAKTGDPSPLAKTGDPSPSAKTGDPSPSANTGDPSPLVKTGGNLK